MGKKVKYIPSMGLGFVEETPHIYSDGYTLGLKYKAMNKGVRKGGIYSVAIMILLV